MALRCLVWRIPAAATAALRPPLGHHVGSRVITAQFHQGKGRSYGYRGLNDFTKLMMKLQQENLIKLQEYDKKMRSWREESDEFHKDIRRAAEDLARHRNKVRKIADVAAVVGVGSFLLAIVARYSL